MVTPAVVPHSALLLDAAGTLLHPARPVPETYARLAGEHGVVVTRAEVGARLGPLMKQAAPLRAGAADWRPFWRRVVEGSTGCADPDRLEPLLDALIDVYAAADAWRVADGAADCCARVRAGGMKIALVSNWDHHLRPLLRGLGIDGWFDAIVISAEEQLEKPDPIIFRRACERLGVRPAVAVHVGNDPDDDYAGATAAGCAALLLGRDVDGFGQLASRLLAPEVR